MSNPQNAILISDFTQTNLAGFLRNDETWPPLDVTVAPFGQVVQILVNPHHECWQTVPQVAVVWTRPESTIAALDRALHFEPVSIDEILAEVDEYAAALLALRERVQWIVVPTWVLPAYRRGLAPLNLHPNSGIGYMLAQMNLRLIHNLQGAANFIVLDTQKWMSTAGSKAFSAKLWYMGKIPYSNEVFKEATRDIKAALRALSGKARKLLIVDLDETLWGGIVGDLGWQGLTLGGHDPAGEALVDFQRELKALANRGTLLGIVSKNEESTALEAIRKHPEMVLTVNDFAAWRINWKDKAQNIADLVSELNLGLDAVVFIDDNPVERARVRQALPDVLVPEWPSDPMLYPQALLSLDCFDAGPISSEDRERVRMYASERQRTSGKATAASLDEWLQSLQTEVAVEPLDPENVTRVVQLLNKTNQMNLSTRRLTSDELRLWAADERRAIFAVRVSDRFGDSGLTGIISVELERDSLRVVDFVLSCRVMGRNVENAMLHFAVEYALREGASQVCLEYLPTGKNKPCLDVLSSCGWSRERDRTFRWNTSQTYPLPGHIQLQANPALATEVGL
jgi:FkbH-like protein